MRVVDLIAECEHVYLSAQFRAGPFGRDAVSIRVVAGQTVIVFSGTQCAGEAGVADWCNDLDDTLVARPEFPGRIHAGFAQSLTNLWPFLSRYGWQPRPWISGHSKGWPLAVLCGWLLRQLRPRVVGFAGPKVGDRAFAAGIQGQLDCLNYVNPYDLVPTLPLVGYARVGREIRPPPRWTPPRGLLANHHLETGYRPWIGEHAVLTSAA